MKETSDKDSFTSSQLLSRNAIYSLVGQGLPLLAAVFSIPLLIGRLGTDRFGILTIAWLVTSYFSLFDVGLGRALTQIVSEKLGSEEKKDIAPLIWTSLILMMFLGVVGTSIFLMASHWLAFSLLKIPPIFQKETLHSFYLLSFTIPFVTCTGGLIGLLSALQRFDLISIVRIPFGLSTFLAPLAATYLDNSLVVVVLSLLIVRIIVWLVYFAMCLSSMPELKQKITFDKSSLLPLIKFGSWMTISNLVGPIMVYIDRIFIGSFISVNAVTYYTVPYEFVTKLWIFPTSLVSVLFPAFSTSFVVDSQKTSRIFEIGLFTMIIVLFPVVLLISVFSTEILGTWVGKNFPEKSSVVLVWLSVGVLINSISQIPFALIQGIGKPDITAKLHLIELPFYLASFWLLSSLLGINGIAIAWTLRVTLDMIMLFYFSSQFISSGEYLIRYNLFLFCCITSCLFLSLCNINNSFKILYTFVLLIVFFPSAWKYILDEKQKKNLLTRFFKLKCS